MANLSNRINWFQMLIAFLLAIFFSACSTINTVPPEVNLMRVDVKDVTLSHVNLLADLRVFNPNEKVVTIQGVDYTLHLEGIKVFSGKSNQSQTIPPQEYGHLTLLQKALIFNFRLVRKTYSNFSIATGRNNSTNFE